MEVIKIIMNIRLNDVAQHSVMSGLFKAMKTHAIIGIMEYKPIDSQILKLP